MLAVEDPDAALSMLADCSAATRAVAAEPEPWPLSSSYAWPGPGAHPPSGRAPAPDTAVGSLEESSTWTARWTGRGKAPVAPRGVGGAALGRRPGRSACSSTGAVRCGATPLPPRRWPRPVSSSPSGEQAACSIVAFAAQPIMLRTDIDPRPVNAVLDDLFSLRGHGTTDLAAAMNAARIELDRCDPRAHRCTLVLSDCLATAQGGDPLGALAGLGAVHVLGTSEDDDAVAARTALAQAAGGRYLLLVGAVRAQCPQCRARSPEGRFSVDLRRSGPSIVRRRSPDRKGIWRPGLASMWMPDQFVSPRPATRRCGRRPPRPAQGQRPLRGATGPADRHRPPIDRRPARGGGRVGWRAGLRRRRRRHRVRRAGGGRAAQQELPPGAGRPWPPSRGR